MINGRLLIPLRGVGESTGDLVVSAGGKTRHDGIVSIFKNTAQKVENTQKSQ